MSPAARRVRARQAARRARRLRGRRQALAEGVRRAGGEALTCPLADGGEGTLAVVCAAGAARRVEVDARDALGRPRRAAIGDCGDGTFLVEAAEAVGLALLAPGERDPRRTGSAGLADLLRGALARGARHVLVGAGRVGDGRRRPRDARRHWARACPATTGSALLGELDARARARPERSSRACELSVLHDVDVPLCGPDGAAVLFGPQKGLRPEDVEPFDRALARLGEAFGGDVAERPGAGAAGGLGAALYALGAGARSGCRGRDRARRPAAICSRARRSA